MEVPVETRMIHLEAKHIFREKNHEKLHIAVHGDDDIEWSLKLSNKWLESFLDRHNFSYRKLGTKLNKKAVTESSLDVIQDYHISLWVLQLSEINDAVCGFTAPYYVYSNDQVPIGIAAPTE